MSGVLNGPRKSVWISIITGITTAPKKDDPHFFQNVNNRILEFDCDINIILGGGFNLIKKAKLDKEGGILFTSHPKALTEVEEIQINLNLGDIWREQNPLDKRFTWRRRNPSISCRLDFFSFKGQMNQNFDLFYFSSVLVK